MKNNFRQPKDALIPSAFSVEAAEKWALKRSSKLPADPFRLIAHWYINYVLQPAPGERKTRYTMKIAHTQKYGISSGLTPVLSDPEPELVGEDVRQILQKRQYCDYIDRTAFVDSVIGHVSRPADERIIIEDSPHAKYVERPEIFAREAKKVLKRKGAENLKGDKPCVVVIGSTAGIISALVRHGLMVTATDLGAEVVGKVLSGIMVQNGKSANTKLIKASDLVIITGMALPNRTLRGLMKLAKENNTSTMIWAITGKNFGQYYTDHGVDSVISDPSPFLLLPGPSLMEIYRRAN